MKTTLFVLVTLAASVSSFALGQSLARDSRAFELRTYTVTPGNFDALHSRFKDHTIRIFQKHGMEVIGFWVPEVEKGKPEQLIYILAHKDRKTADENWAAMRADPEWIKAKADSEKRNGSLTIRTDSQFMTATDYSPIK